MGKPVIDTHTGSDGCTGYADTAEYDGHAGYTGYAGIRRGLQVEFAEGAVEPSKIHRGVQWNQVEFAGVCSRSVDSRQ